LILFLILRPFFQPLTIQGTFEWIIKDTNSMVISSYPTYFMSAFITVLGFVWAFW